jgi:hypothetical protein
MTTGKTIFKTTSASIQNDDPLVYVQYAKENMATPPFTASQKLKSG